jgi:hypothetical protein
MIFERENNSSNSKINKKYDATMLLNNFDSRAAIKSKTSWNSVFSAWQRISHCAARQKRLGDFIKLARLSDRRAIIIRLT